MNELLQKNSIGNESHTIILYQKRILHNKNANFLLHLFQEDVKL
jgi:hypothetical protein